MLCRVVTKHIMYSTAQDRLTFLPVNTFTMRVSKLSELASRLNSANPKFHGKLTDTIFTKKIHDR